MIGMFYLNYMTEALVGAEYLDTGSYLLNDHEHFG